MDHSMLNTLIENRALWLSAYVNGDTAALENIEMPQFTVINNFGIQSKQEQLKGIAEAIRSGGWFPNGTKTEDFEREVHIQGEIAIIRGLGRTVTPKHALPTIAFTELWQNTGSTWKALHLHYSEIKKPCE